MNKQTELKRFCNNFRNAFTASGFESVAELARESGVDYSTIIIAMRGKRVYEYHIAYKGL